MRGEGRASSLTVSRNNIHNAVREPCLDNQFAQPQAGKRGLLGGLQHNRAAGSKRGAQLPGGHQQRKVPGNDLADHADRLFECVGKVLCARSIGDRERDGVALNFCGPSRHIAKQIHGKRNVGGFCDGKGLAIVQRFQVGKFFRMLLQQVGEFPDQSPALGCGHSAPGTIVERRARRLNGPLDIFAITFRDPRQHFTSGGVVRRKSLSGSGLNPLSVDQHLAWPLNKLSHARVNLY